MRRWSSLVHHEDLVLAQTVSPSLCHYRHHIFFFRQDRKALFSYTKCFRNDTPFQMEICSCCGWLMGVKRIFTVLWHKLMKIPIEEKHFACVNIAATCSIWNIHSTQMLGPCPILAFRTSMICLRFKILVYRNQNNIRYSVYTVREVTRRGFSWRI